MPRLPHGGIAILFSHGPQFAHEDEDSLDREQEQHMTSRQT